jgi:CheY-like chemotaxis protein
MDYIALIVDDDQPTLLFLEQVLSPLDLHVMRAEDGAQALELLENYTPVIMFLDMLMPTVSGLEVLEFIDNTPRLNNVFVAVVSAHRSFEAAGALQRANAYYVKPIRPKDIRDVTQNALARQAPR